MEAQLPWYRALSAEERSWLGLVAQAGIASFVSWYADPAANPRVTADVFATVPRELTRSVTLSQTLDLVRTVIEIVEADVAALAAPGEENDFHLAVLHYSRELAFAAAQIYARAAEARGAWDARLESLVVDAVLRGEADDELASRASALGWGDISPVAVVAGSTAPTSPDATIEDLRTSLERRGGHGLLAVQGRWLILIIGGVADPVDMTGRLVSHFGDGPVVVGPRVPHLFAAGRSARAAMSGLRAAPAWPEAPRPVAADDLLPERVLVGDLPARRGLVDRVFTPLRDAGSGLFDTAAAYLSSGRGLEATARVLFVHPNTVRYRLGRIAEVTGYDITHPRDAYVVQQAIAVGRLEAAGSRERRRPGSPDSPPSPVSRPQTPDPPQPL
ncbi:MAG: helix-turn-helix domain-containing protein [Austwickia sp.]|nr:helix-turn-helix domain-containing protein [Austwickia sp.]MBK8435166.1 helix-turn-helix domain-containing protein [Austwickia sp.]MBK9101280.1 helix-turn-helix domain-containing protein [Austwickia sp.]